MGILDFLLQNQDQPQGGLLGGMPQYQNAISGIESGGKYDALGPITQKGDRALGKYQIMGSNIGPWSQEVLGQPVTPEQFLSNPQLQDQIFQGKFGQYVQKYGPEGAARAWFAGEGGMNDMGRKDQLGTSVASYAQKFNKGLGGGEGGLLNSYAPEPQGAGLLGGSGQDTLGQAGPAAPPAPTAGRPPPNIPDPGLGDRLMSGFSSFANSNGILPAIANGISGFAGGPDRQVAAARYILSRPDSEIEPALKAAVIKNPQLAMAILQRDALPPDKQFKSEGGVYGSFDPRSGKVNMQGVAPKVENVAPGNSVHVVQPGLPGVPGAQPGMPPGMAPPAGLSAPGASPMDAPGAGVTPVVQGMSLEDKNAAEARGKAKGEAQTSLPKAVENAAFILDAIKQVEKHPGLSQGTGMMGKVTRNLPGSNAYDFNAAVEQVRGKAFLDAYQSLKGAGAITEIEGQKATAAIGRLDPAQSEPAFREGLKDLKEVVTSGLARAKQMAGVSPGANVPGTANLGPQRSPKPGTIMDGHIFKGGNPADPASWQMVQ